jgi:N-acetylmuramoyl-L-alanine amidase
LIILLAWIGSALGGELTDVRLFSGSGHARLLLIHTGEPANIRTRSVPSIGGSEARAIVLLGSVSAEGIENRTINEDGLNELSITAVNSEAQITVTMSRARTVRASTLSPGVILVDLIEEGRGEDPSLPTSEQLRAWLEGVSFAPQQVITPRGYKLVVVDAGHGGWDHGAVGTTGTREADVALQIAHRVAQGLEAELGVEVLMTREDDTFIPLRQRAAIANQAGADLFLSIHANAAPGPGAWGIETYSMDTASDGGAARVARRENVLARENGESEEPLLIGKLLSDGTNKLSRELAMEVQNNVVRRLEEVYGSEAIRDLGAKTALFYVLVSTRMPAILFESSFVSNPEDEKKLRTPHFQQAEADAIVEAVGHWLERQE